MTEAITDNRALRRFEMSEQGEIVFADYREAPGRLFIDHVEAPPRLRGSGAAGRLMEGIVGLSRRRSLAITPVCSYAVAWLRRHPDALGADMGPD